MIFINAQNLNDELKELQVSGCYSFILL